MELKLADEMNGKISKLILIQKGRDIFLKERTSKGKRALFCFLAQRIKDKTAR